jgi:hypothetical protein
MLDAGTDRTPLSVVMLRDRLCTVKVGHRRLPNRRIIELMSNESGRNPLWYLAGVVVVGLLAWWVIKIVLGLIFYVVVGVIVVGGVVYLAGKTRRSLGGGRRRKIGG